MLNLEAKFLPQVFCGFFSIRYIVQLTQKQLEQFSCKIFIPHPLPPPQTTLQRKKIALKNCSTLILKPRGNKKVAQQKY